ncbi:hypothetical protein F3I16_00925 [Pseudomonas sp. L-22-4S-12]|nr:hypothetical protein [Pseudomonas sp. L-22-4S-12]MWV14592.1 hypothetical protein [Pseudomonas sp. L-22-4S-12]
MTRAERVRLWSALSDAFVDNPVDYTAIARQLAAYPRDRVKTAFFEDVAPVCYSNLQAPIPPIWTAFDSIWLAETIDGIHRARRASVLRRLRDSAWIAYLRHRLKPEWENIARALDRQAG